MIANWAIASLAVACFVFVRVEIQRARVSTNGTVQALASRVWGIGWLTVDLVAALGLGWFN